MKLTVKKIQGITKAGSYGDGRNLWLIVGSTGLKRWEFRYTLNGRPRQMGLGSLDLMKLNEARDKALELRRMVQNGEDPIDARKGQKPPPSQTFEDVAEKCVTSLETGWSNPKQERQWRSSLASYVYPDIGKRSVALITTEDVFDILQPIWSTKSETANRVRMRIEKVLDFANALKLRSGENPARWKGNLDALLPKITKVKVVRHHPALPYDETGQFVAALRGKEGISPRSLEFTILTAARTNEAIGARWSEFDFNNATWTIPADRMKAQREHRVPLSKAAIALLRALPRDTESEDGFVFISPRSKNKPLSNMAMLKTLKLMERQDLTVHGFRSTFRDWAAETTGYQDIVVEMALAHTVGNAVEAAYRRGDLFEKRTRLMNDWAEYCDQPASKADVVPIHGETS